MLERVIEYGNEWMPNDHAELTARVAELGRMAAGAGRAPILVTAFAVEPDRKRVEQLRRAGVARCVFNLRSSCRDEVRDGL